MTLRISGQVAALAMATALMPQSAWAQSSPDSASELAAMRAELEALKRQVSVLEQRLSAAHQAESPKMVAQAAPVAATAPPPSAPSAPAKPDTEITFKGAPEIKTASGWSFKPRGRLLFDAGIVSSPAGITDKGLGFASEARRARLGVEGSIPGGFGYKFEVDFAAAETEITDAFLSYKDKALLVTIGQHNNFQSLEEISSSNDTSFIERAAFTDAFGFSRRLGVSAEWHKGDLLVQGGVFSDAISALGNDENDTYSIDGRVVYAPKLGKTQLHLGASGHWRDEGDSVISARYRQRPLVHTTDTRFIDTGVFGNVHQTSSWGLEAAAISGRFHFSAESHWQQVSRAGVADPTFFGTAIEAGVYLTDDTRGYRDGMFKSMKVKNPVNKGGIGAVQLNVRYDRLDLNSAGIFGGSQDGYMASLIWTPIDYVRFLINYGHLSYEDAALIAGSDRDYSVDVLGMRAQISF